MISSTDHILTVLDLQTTPSPPFVEVYAVVHVAVRDVGGIYSLHIYDLDSGEEYGPNKLGYTHYDLEHKFSASLLQAGVGSVTIRVYAEDYAGNSIQVQKNLSGAFGVVLNVLSELWSQFWSALQKVAQAVARAMDVIIEWAKSFISQIATIFQQMLELFNSFGLNLLQLFLQSYEHYNQTGQLGPEVSKINEIINQIGIIVGVMVGTVIATLTILDVVSMGIGSIIINIATGLIILAIMEYLQAMISQVGTISMPTTPTVLSPQWIISIIEKMISWQPSRAHFSLYLSANSANSPSGIDIPFVLGWILSILGTFSSFYAVYMVAKVDFTGMVGVFLSIFSGIVGIALGGAAS